MRKVAAQHRFHETGARLDHDALNTPVIWIISWSKEMLLTSSVQVERKRCSFLYLLRRSNVSCLSFASFWLFSFFLHVNRYLTCSNERCATPARLSMDPVKNIYRAGLDGDARACSTILPPSRCVLRITLMQRIHDCTYHRHHIVKSPYLSRIPLTSCSALWVSSLHWEPPTGS